jgi:hypothetical protein
MERWKKYSNNVHPSNIYLLYVAGFSPSIYRRREVKPKKGLAISVRIRRGLRDIKYEKRSHPSSTKKRPTEKSSKVKGTNSTKVTKRCLQAKKHAIFNHH